MKKRKWSSPTGRCTVSGNCDFIEVSSFVPMIPVLRVSIWYCNKCKRYANAGYHDTGATYNYDIRICDIEGTMFHYWKQDFPLHFTESNEHLWKWYSDE